MRSAVSFLGPATILLLLGCADDSGRPSTAVDPGSADVIQVALSPVTVTLDAPLFRVGGSAASGLTAFGRVRGGVIDSGERLWIGDDQASHIVRLDRSGDGVDAVGRRGQGPGEFLQVEIMGWSAGRVATYDVEQRRVVLIDPATDETTTHPLYSPQWDDRPRMMMGIGSRGEHVFIPLEGFVGFELYETPAAPGWYRSAEQRVVVQRSEDDSDVVLSGAPYAEWYMDGDEQLAHPLRTVTQARVHADTVAFVGTLAGDVFVARLDGTYRRAFNMSEEPGAALGADALERAQDLLEAIPPERRRYYVTLEQVREHGLPERRPYFDRVVISTDGVMWLRRAQDVGGPVRRWDVITLRGTHLGTASLPRGEDVLAASPTRVATVSRDEYEAQIVSLHEHPFRRVAESGR